MTQSSGLPATLAGFSDRAVFTLFVHEAALGRVESAWSPEGRIETRTEVTYAGQTVEATVRIDPDPDGRWHSITVVTPLGARTVTRDGTGVQRTFKDTTSTFDSPEGAVLFENEAPVLLSQALRLYDHGRGGTQRFPVIIGGRPPDELSLEATDTARRSVSGTDLALTRFRIELPGVAIFVWADAASRMHLMEIPSQDTVLVREGSEALRTLEPSDPLLSSPRYEVVVERGVGIPMRDGVCLSADIYLPRDAGPAPVILARTPYKKELLELQAMFYARRGYVYAAQDCRGCFGSPGVWEAWVNEGRDGYDTIEWLAAQPYANGKVGTIGPSYLGLAQWCAAAHRPPHLVTMIPNVSPPDPFHNIPYEYGVFFLWGAIWWSEVNETGAGADISGAGLYRIADKPYAELLRTLPVIDLDVAILGKQNPSWRRWIAHPADDDYWEPARFSDHLAHCAIPVFHQSGWFDGDGIGSKLNYLRMASHGHPYQKLTLGPWGHTDTAQRMARNRDFGENALIDLPREYLRWFDRWLKGIDNGIDREPLVSLFVMGANRWAHGPAYPLETSSAQRWYLAPGGKLTCTPPDGQWPPDTYRYDPGDPTPDPAFYQEPDADRKRVRTAEERKREAEAHHRAVAAGRQDIVIYESDPLAQPLTFAGPLSAVLSAASSAVDTDWFITLSEVDEHGGIFQLVQGKLRARFRKSLQRPELLAPDEIYTYTLDLWHTAIRIPPGGRLRVEIASAAFPMFSRNLNTGGHNEVETEYVAAEQAIYHDQRHPSYIVLPYIVLPVIGEGPAL
jgi:putative CocE/NonD family hydrolase